ncbi:MAG TPA: aldo/keto reductase [Phycisphaerae bacterium]|nr:aldo/keto reductase [Phycisphaerae bacterium]
MAADLLTATFGRGGPEVFRLGLSATYRPGRAAIHYALDEGINVFFCYGFDTHMTRTLRELPASRRERIVIATGAYNLLIGHFSLRRTLEKRLRQLRTDYLDAFLYLGVTKPKHFPPRTREELTRLCEEGKVRRIGMSCHDRRFAGELAAAGALDAFMVRYNAAHRGAEQDIFPHLAAHDPALISYTATRWRYLLRAPRGWPPRGRVPTAGECYRFVLTNPHVDVCLTAPSNATQLRGNLAAVRAGPLNDDDLAFMCQFGDAVHHTAGWFM